MKQRISELFRKNPMQYGLQGDPYLWKALEQHFEEVEFPDSEEELKVLLESAFENLTEYNINYEKSF